MITGILETIIGIVFGACLGYLVFRKESAARFSATLFMEYKNIAQELAEILSNLKLQSLMPLGLTDNEYKRIDDELGLFFYKYYLVLPQQVLEELNCLHECLLSHGKQTYVVKYENAIPTVQPRISDDEVSELMREVAIVKTKRNLFDIYQRYGRLPRFIFLKCQARHVITVMYDCWNLSNIHEWEKRLPKQTISQIEKKKMN